MSDSLKIDLMLLAATESAVSNMRMKLSAEGEEVIRAYTQFFANVARELNAVPYEHRSKFALLMLAEHQLNMMKSEIYDAAGTTAASLASAASRRDA